MHKALDGLELCWGRFSSFIGEFEWRGFVLFGEFWVSFSKSRDSFSFFPILFTFLFVCLCLMNCLDVISSRVPSSVSVLCSKDSEILVGF